jgi:hypothetical protein
MTYLLAATPAWMIALLLALLMAGGWELGRRIGTRRKHSGESVDTGNFGDPTMALLGLLIAFTFSLSLGKHDQRRALVIQEANAIGDFYTTATLLDDPLRSELQGTIREYLQARLELQSHPVADSVLLADLQRMHGFHARLTEIVARAAHDRAAVIVPLAASLAAVTSTHSSRLAAFRDRLPGSIVLLLFFASIVSIGLSGRDQALTANVQLLGTLCLILLVSLTVFVTLDLNQPLRGLITVSNEPFEHLLMAMGAK